MSERNMLQGHTFTFPRLDLGQVILAASVVLVAAIVVLVLRLVLGLSLVQSLVGGALYLAGLYVIYAIFRRARRVTAMREEIADLRDQLELMRLGQQQRQAEAKGSPPAAQLPVARDQAPEHSLAFPPEPQKRAHRDLGPTTQTSGHDQSTLAEHVTDALARHQAGRPRVSGGPPRRPRPEGDAVQHSAGNRPPSSPPEHGATATAGGEPAAAPTQARDAAIAPRSSPPGTAAANPGPSRQEKPAPEVPGRAKGNSSLDVDMMQNLIEQLAAKLNPAQDPANSHNAGAVLSHPADTPAASGLPDPAWQPSHDPRKQAPGQTDRYHPRPDDHPEHLQDVGADAPYGKLALIAEAVEANRIEIYLEPILGLDDRKARHFEFSLRLRTEGGQELTADHYAPVAAGTGLLSRIDATKLQRAAEVAHRLRDRGKRSALFSALSGESLADEYFLDSFADLLVSEDGLGTRLVLTFPQAEARTFAPAHWQSISAMSRIGLKFALSDVTDLDMDFPALKKYGFEYIKLDASVFLNGLPVPRGHVPAADICRYLSEEGFGLIVGGIVAERDLAKIVGFGAVLGQGTLFGGPRSVVVDRSRRAA